MASPKGSAEAADRRFSLPSKSGAVLWFLHRHAPMPEEIAGTQIYKGDGIEEATEAAADRPTPTTPASGGAPKPASTRAKEDGMQRDFLHRAVVSIGAELDEGRRHAECVFKAHEHKPPSAHQRDILRHRYEAHADAEYKDLQATVEQREREVKQLRRKVEDLQSQVKQTRAASERRQQRMGQSGRPDSLFADKTAAAVVVDPDSKFVLPTAAAGQEGQSQGKQKVDDLEELQWTVNKNFDAEVARCNQVDDTRRLLQTQTLQRRAAEAALCMKQTEIINLRTRTHAAEAREHRLLLEVKRVYRSLPQVVEERLAQSVRVRAALEEQTLLAIKNENRKELFKFKDTEEIEAAAKDCFADIEEVKERKKRVTEMMQRGIDELQLDIHLHRVEVAMSSLQDVWQTFDVSQRADGVFVASLDSSEHLEELLGEARSAFRDLKTLFQVQSGEPLRAR